MKRSNILAAVAATVTIFAGVVFAAPPTSSTTTTTMTPGAGTTTTTTTPADMEQCKIVDKNGVGLIKPGMGSTGQNVAGDPNAWIYVPKGQCVKINAGDMTGVSQDIKDKIVTN